MKKKLKLQRCDVISRSASGHSVIFIRVVASILAFMAVWHVIRCQETSLRDGEKQRFEIGKSTIVIHSYQALPYLILAFALYSLRYSTSTSTRLHPRVSSSHSSSVRQR